MIRLFFYLVLLFIYYSLYSGGKLNLHQTLFFGLPALALFAFFDLFLLKKIKIKKAASFALLFALFSGSFLAVTALLKTSGVSMHPAVLISVLFLLLYSAVHISASQSLHFFLPGAADNAQETGKSKKILDTSAIIDGRIADVGETGFIDGPFIIPVFVLKELQQVADSKDSQKRIRGRRGLDMLENMKKSERVSIMIDNTDFPEAEGVDSKLILLAKKINARIITTDYNLNKLAKVEDIIVLNINDLAITIKPIVLPGDTFRILVSKPGKEKQQGIGYLSDGTMVVVEDGKKFLNHEKTVCVTSMIQNPSGRMIFSKIN